MDTVLKLASRNIKIYVRDRMSVFFSFLSAIIIIGLYALFLGKIQVDNIVSSVGDIKGISALVSSWIVSGLLAVNAVTVALGVLGTMVFDIEHKRFPDFVVAPVSRTGVVVSYLISAWVISFLFSLIVLAAGELYILSSGGELLSLTNFIKVLGILALSVVSASSIMYLMTSFLRSGSAFGTASTLVGTLIGFLTGVYVPVGVLPPAIQKLIDFIPFSHSAAMLRQVFCEQPMKTVFGMAPQQVIDAYEKMNGVRLFWNDAEITMPMMIAVLAGVAVVFLLLSVNKLRVSRRKTI